ncbi:GGDEF domain-containing response regulator [Alteromonas ponticola]|uniref:diguanylate cyclase n=1 Tax=Alteromonas ponticola TaxID=2720613 RepID=A0ABX1R3R0_9ALTE|nr:diguanylate cyclase [Alteromonas ponticola]NMH61085.1 diguanylate cyclase [Alteromonas ponticola]
MSSFLKHVLNTPNSGAKIFIVEDDEITLQMLLHNLGKDYHVIGCNNPLDAIRQMKEAQPDLIMLDMEMPSLSGLELCKQIKTTPQLETLPVVFLTGHDDKETQLKCWEVGCVDFVPKPIVFETLNYRLQTHIKLKLITDRLSTLAMLDGLTNVYNRRYLENYLKEHDVQEKRDYQVFTLMMLDIDYFKRYNDRYGHQQGDECLRSVAQVLSKTAARNTDFVARYGGEEFILMLPATDDKGAKLVSMNIHQALAKRKHEHADSEVGRVTLSVGCVTAVAPHAITPMIEEADKLLYEAKQAGRNQTRFGIL